MSECECLKCDGRFTCDFALSAWAAKSRMMDKGIKVRFKTYDCSKSESLMDVIKRLERQDDKIYDGWDKDEA